MKINTHENIEVQLVDYRLKVLGRSDQNFRNIHDHVIDKCWGNPAYPFVSTIDPYSYTLFNSLQVPLLVQELELLASEDDDADFKKAVGDLIEYINVNPVHNFIRFMGD